MRKRSCRPDTKCRWYRRLPLNHHLPGLNPRHVCIAPHNDAKRGHLRQHLRLCSLPPYQ